MAPTSSSSNTAVTEDRNTLKNKVVERVNDPITNLTTPRNAKDFAVATGAQRGVSVPPKFAVESKAGKPEEKTEQQKLLKWHQAFQHCYAQKARGEKCVDCERCGTVNPLLQHKKSCVSTQCGFCQVVGKVTQFHRDKCRILNNGEAGYCLFCAENGFGFGGNENTDKQTTPTKTPQCTAKNTKHNIPDQQNIRVNQPSQSSSHFGQETIIDEMMKISNVSLIGKTFIEGEDYQLEGNLGRGGNGTVMAAKLLKPGKSKLGVDDDQFLAAKICNVSVNERTVYKTLAEAPNIEKHFFVVDKKQCIPWFDKKTKKQYDRKFTHLMFMERADKSLLDYRKEFPSHILSLETASFYWAEILKNLEYSHGMASPVVHKDIKSNNVLLTREAGGRYRTHLADYEFAIILKKGRTHMLERHGGTKLFMAPEILDRRDHGTAADIYAMGILFLELAIPDATNPPGNACWSEYRAGKVDELKEKHLGIGKMVEDCLNADAKKRPSADNLLQKIRKYAAQAGWWLREFTTSLDWK